MGAANHKKRESAPGPGPVKVIGRPAKLENIVNAWPFSPHRWDGISWVTVHVSFQQSKEQKDFDSKDEITILSYNAWFGNHRVEQRMKAIADLIENHDPDLIALQEMTPFLLRHLLSHKCIRNYILSDPTGKEYNRYGNMILSKVNFSSLYLRNFESNQGRKALWGKVPYRGKEICFGTFHLESYPKDHPYRKQQMCLFSHLTREDEIVILTGDSNINFDDEGKNFGERFADAWEQLYQKTSLEKSQNPGITFDLYKNRMGREAAGFSMKARLDRCFYTHSILQPHSMEVIGTEPFETLASEGEEEEEIKSPTPSTPSTPATKSAPPAHSSAPSAPPPPPVSRTRKDLPKVKKKATQTWPSDHWGIVMKFSVNAKSSDVGDQETVDEKT
eukprot:TRINITY_DN491_c0_g1_i1.p1 TRINITY_DN491_c0_g1~~TRINITY_DN491_c0_g1_i1.p1  ORF type:complete len:389 (-),score=54.50 TRINITY_DN491_c0_g1_i1:51-1217(-)